MTNYARKKFGWLGMNVIHGADGEHETPYMLRAWIGRLRLHLFYRGDADPDCHDHPWDFWTLPLTSYVEEVVTANAQGQRSTARRVVRRWRIHHRPAEHCHRVLGAWDGTYNYDIESLDLLPGESITNLQVSRPLLSPGVSTNKIWTIVWRGNIRRKWGFLKNAEGQWCWVPWKDYVFGGGKTAPCSDYETK